MKALLLALLILPTQSMPVLKTVYIPVDIHAQSYLMCDIQIQPEIKQGFVDLDSCVLCRIDQNDTPLCISKPR